MDLHLSLTASKSLTVCMYMHVCIHSNEVGPPHYMYRLGSTIQVVPIKECVPTNINQSMKMYNTILLRFYVNINACTSNECTLTMFGRRLCTQLLVSMTELTFLTITPTVHLPVLYEKDHRVHSSQEYLSTGNIRISYYHFGGEGGG